MAKKGLWIALAVVAVIAISLYGFFKGTYNDFVALDQQVKSSWAQVENQLQRRFELVPNLVETVKGYAAQEKSVFTEVAEARARVGQITVTREVLEDPDAFAKFQQAQDGLSSALSRLLAVAENYPELKSNENFMALQNQLEGTENRITVARKGYNDVVQSFNTTVRTFPGSMVAGFAGFREKPYFKAKEGSDVAPQVKF